MSAARKRKKLAHLPYVEALTSARYDLRFERLERAGQLWDITGYQAPVKYNRCKTCGYRRHCAPNLVDMKIAQGKTGRKIA